MHSHEVTPAIADIFQGACDCTLVKENRAFNILYSRKYDEELENTLRSMRAEAFIEIKDLD